MSPLTRAITALTKQMSLDVAFTEKDPDALIEALTQITDRAATLIRAVDHRVVTDALPEASMLSWDAALWGDDDEKQFVMIDAVCIHAEDGAPLLRIDMGCDIDLNAGYDPQLMGRLLGVSPEDVNRELLRANEQKIDEALGSVKRSAARIVHSNIAAGAKHQDSVSINRAPCAPAALSAPAMAR